MSAIEWQDRQEVEDSHEDIEAGDNHDELSDPLIPSQLIITNSLS